MRSETEVRIRWLLDFLLMEITFDGDGRLVRPRPGAMLDLQADVQSHLVGPTAALDPEEELTGRALGRFRASLIAGMEELEKDGRWSVSSEVIDQGRKIDRRVGWALERQEDGTIRRWYEDAKSGDAILLAAASDLIAEWWPHLRRCEYDECRTWFLPRDKRQRYHEPACRHRNHAAGRERDYAEEHARRVERTNGPGPAKKLRKRQAKRKAQRKGGKR